MTLKFRNLIINKEPDAYVKNLISITVVYVSLPSYYNSTSFEINISFIRTFIFYIHEQCAERHIIRLSVLSFRLILTL